MHNIDLFTTITIVIVLGIFFAVLFYAYRNTVLNIIKEHQNEIKSLEKKCDAAEKKANDMERRMNAWEKNAITDELTDLHSRKFFLECYRHNFLTARRKKHDLQIIYLDIDNTKLVNDNLGHKKGDELLKGFAELLKRTYRESDIIGRLGGDEFGILMSETTKKQAEEVTKRFLMAIKKEQKFDEFRPLGFSASVGIVSFDSNEPEKDLIHAADLEMYKIKKNKARVQ